MRKVVAASFAGAMLEWYDFFVFGTASGLVFGRLFFAQSDPMMGIIAAFATFGVGFFARPIGGIVFGHFGDRVGRKVTLIWTLLIVGLSTFLIGLLPTYDEVGVLAPILLVLLRIVQGFGLGGEYGGAALMTIESSPQSRRGFMGSLPQAAASAGIMLATGVFSLCNWLLSESQFMLWGWRIPFLLSIVMLIVGMYIRVHVEETGDFQRAHRALARSADAEGERPKESLPIVELFRRHPKNILLALGARLAETVSSNAINAFGIAYISSQLGMGRQVPLTGMLIASAVGIVLCPVIGRLSDRWGQKPIYLAGAAFCAVFIFPFFNLLATKDIHVIWAALIVAYLMGPTSMFAVQPTMFSRMFGTRVRYTGLSFAYQFSAILGGLTPLIASSLLAMNGGRPWFVAGYLAAISTISFVCVCLIKPHQEIDGHAVPSVVGATSTGK
ncbi:MFS transporter, MHS family, shikimate and dehydroshikimate transport protein [Propionivibrio dicarboxylicus]|uniref:MFS transporter, MHS family, shikimate and dehydroshikimate transport protein n=2 Tax=Propionivibrio dicarboxylicus TaxID=83767 RepID=A0A1G8EU22_9RHOO|nr:MFS transporter, MHS family, shikimate and dehydroshikimate transport protein [Propionivibrio dicarboxylicus]